MSMAIVNEVMQLRSRVEKFAAVMREQGEILRVLSERVAALEVPAESKQDAAEWGSADPPPVMPAKKRGGNHG